MIKFIEEKTNADGEIIGVPYNTNLHNDNENYRFYFDDNQSTNLIYQKRLFFLSDASSIDVSFPNNHVFFLFDYISAPSSIDDVKKFTVTSTGVACGSLYLHYVNIGASSDTEGEFIENITIGDEIFEIAADFHGQDESLEILLHNQGITLPKDIIRSIYDTNVHEKYVDWVTLNRKYKELLLNIMDIVYKKGSYQSLVSSLGWFEYGNEPELLSGKGLVKLNEYWSDPTLKALHQKDITTVYTPMLEEMVRMYMKTTFISLEYTLDEFDKDKDGYKYDNDNGELTVPILKNVEDIQRKWSINDIALKMTLLGNYFSTYFMPIHLDLLFSSIENRVFTSIAKCKEICSNVRIDDTYMNDMMSVVVTDKVLSRFVIGDITNANIVFNKDNTFGYFVDTQMDQADPSTYPLYNSLGATIEIPIRVIHPVDGTKVTKISVLVSASNYRDCTIYNKFTYINKDGAETEVMVPVGNIDRETGDITYIENPFEVYYKANVSNADISKIPASISDKDKYVKLDTQSAVYDKIDSIEDLKESHAYALDIPVDFNVNEDYILKVYTEVTGKYNINIIAYATDGLVGISDPILTTVTNPDYNHIIVYPMERIKDIEEMNIHIFDTHLVLPDTPDYVDIVPSYVYRRDKRIPMYYPDDVCNYVSACIVPENGQVYVCKNWTGSETDTYSAYPVTDFIKKEYTEITKELKTAQWEVAYREFEWISGDDITGIYRLLIIFSTTSNPAAMYTIRPTDDPEMNKHSYYNSASGGVTVKVKDKDGKDKEITLPGYIYPKWDVRVENIDGENLRERIPVFFNEKRFIPTMWKFAERKKSSTKNDAIYIAVPSVKNTRYVDNTWVITNESTGQSGKIKGLISPIFWTNNSKSNKTPRGIYSVTLNTKYPNGEIKSTTFDHAFRVE